MIIDKVTITGADDSTDIQQLIDLSHEFKFVEWGILVSKRQEGGYRFPSRDWIDRFVDEAAGLNVSTHLCGKWVRDLLIGQLNRSELPDSVLISQRIQINTHAEIHPYNDGLMDNLRSFGEKQFIFQWDGINEHITRFAAAQRLNVAALFDTSGGAGIAPRNWPRPDDFIPCGYAGGLGPNNLIEQVMKIDAACPSDYSTWIDMERRVRTPDDSALDMYAVRKVLESISTSIWIKQSEGVSA